MNTLIEETDGFVWENWHLSRGVGGRVAKLFAPRNRFVDGSTVQGQKFRPGLEGLQALVRRAEADGRRIRCVGGGWSLTPIAFVDDYLVDTQHLSEWFVGFQTAAFVEPARHATMSRLVYAQCGVRIATLYTFLEGRGLTLPTSGASNGQTIAGAVSTGTHGSAHAIGGMQDYILGLHVIGEGGRHFWIERASRPAATPAFAAWLGATHVRDDELFLAALVSFGCFGIVHAVMFEATKLRAFELFARNCDWADAEDAALSLRVGGLELPYGDELPFHFEVVVNPYRRGAGEKGAFVRVLYDRPLTGPAPTPSPTNGAAVRGRDLIGLAGAFSDLVPELVPGILQGQLEGAVPPTPDGPVLTTPGIQFGDSTRTNGGTSVELGVPLAQLGRALDVVFAVAEEQPFGAPVALRYVKASDALLAFTCHAPITCTIELPGIDSQRAHAAHDAMFARLRAEGIAVTYHWGQRGPEDPTRLLGFDPTRIQRWLAARSAFLETWASRHMFGCAMTDRIGLTR